MAAYKYPRFVEIIDELPKTTSGKIMRRLLQTTTREAASPMRGAELAPVVVPAAARGRRGARRARGRRRLAAPQPRFACRAPRPKRSTSGCTTMPAQLDEAGRFVDRDAFLAANEAYHAAVVGLAENEHLSQGFRRLRLRELLASALKDTPAARRRT